MTSGQQHAGAASPPAPALLWEPGPQEPDRETIIERARREQAAEQDRRVRSLARIVAQACMEAEAGLRPARQLAAWLDLATYGKMTRRADLAERTRTDHSPAAAPRALNARCVAVTHDVYEASATVQIGGRVRALAMRIERHRRRWKVTAVELG